VSQPQVNPGLGWRIRAQVLGPHSARWVAGLAMLLTVPTLFMGLTLDDFIHQAMLDELLPGGPWRLFSFQSGQWEDIRFRIEHGPLPWWTSPTLKLVFLRPLACALALFDHRVFGHTFLWHHLHSAAWYLLTIAAAGQVFHRAFAASWATASLATLLFAIDDAHFTPVAFLANRHALVSAALSLLGVAAHLKWRHDNTPGFLLASMGLSVLGLCAGESALGGLAYTAAYELVGVRSGLWVRLKALAPMAMVLIAYAAIYRIEDAGAASSGMYLDPLREPLSFASSAPGRALALASGQLWGLPSDAWLVSNAAKPVLVTLGALAVGLVSMMVASAWPGFSTEQRRTVAWLGLGTGLSLLPALATSPMNRLLLLPGVGASGIVAILFLSPRSRFSRWGSRLLFVTHVVAAPVGWAASTIGMGLSQQRLETQALRPLVDDQALAKRVIFFTAPDAAAAYVPEVRRFQRKPTPLAWHTFSYAARDHRLTRLSATILEFEVLRGHFLETELERLTRSTRLPMAVGERVFLEGVEVEVIELHEGFPRKIRLHFSDNPDGETYSFVAYDDGHIVPFRLPAVGESVVLSAHWFHH
jgi:hypothetical protein